MRLTHLVFSVLLMLLTPGAVFAASNQWSGTGPFATGAGNRTITTLAVSPNGWTVYAGTGSGTVHSYTYSTPPTINVNTGLTLDQGSTASIPTSKLSATDTDSAVGSLLFTLTTAPSYGQLENSGSPGVAISSFTQQNLVDGTIRYVHDGTNTISESVIFTVSDGANELTGQVFNITINPMSYTLSYTADGNGVVAGTSPQTVNHGASGTAVEAVAESGYRFQQWSDGSTDNPRIDTNVFAGISVVAQFADAIPPGVPSSVAAVEVDDGSIQLSWTNPPDSDFDHCVLYRSLSPGTLGNIISASTTSHSYLDGPGLVGGLTYYYKLRAVDATGNESPTTTQVSITLSDYEGSGLTCTLITSLPYVITTQGLYCLEAPLATSALWGAAIEIRTNNVTIDFKGNTIDNLTAGMATNSYGVYAFRRKNIVLKNGRVQGFRSGIYLDGGSGHQVLDNNLDANTQYGLYMSGQGKIEGNLIVNTGGRAGSDVASIYLNTGASLVRNSIIIGFDAPTGYAANGIHLAQSGQNLVQNNTISGPIGGSATTSGIYINNDVPGSDIISANMITGVVHGLRLENDVNVVLRKNSFANCTNDYTVGAGSSTDDAGDNYPTIP